MIKFNISGFGVIGAVITICILVFMVFAIRFISVSINEPIEMIGNEVVYLGDTVSIIDYSVWSENYTLDNGVKVDVKFFENE